MEKNPNLARVTLAIYRRLNPRSTRGLHWKRQGEFITFDWDGFVATTSVPMLFARHHYECATIERVLASRQVQASLEFGCGFGRLSPVLEPLAQQHTAIDINAAAIEAAKIAYPRIDFRTYDGQGLPFADASFGRIVAWTVLQHVPPDRIDAALGDLMRVLRPDGHLLLCEETRYPGQASRHAWHREPGFYERRFSPLRLTYSSYIEEIDRISPVISPGCVMLFEP